MSAGATDGPAPLARWLQRAVNLGAAAVLLWFATPLVAIDGRHPFDSPLARLALAGALLALLLAIGPWRRWQARRRNARMLRALADGPQGEEPDQRYRQALQLLHQAPGFGHRRARRQVRQLPWYLIVGAPGAGKTTALLHAGLRFPLAEQLGRDPLGGIGGTRHCDWWFSDEAVFIDTAGRYTTQDSDARADAGEWSRFLAVLRRHRPLQPINGVVVTVSVPDLLAGGPELSRQAGAIAQRLAELRRELDLSFPVYLLVTKADLLQGFAETFGDLDAAGREQLWGVVFDAAAGGLPRDLGARLAELAQRLERRTPDVLQHERVRERRLPIHAFGAQLQALLGPLESFVRGAFAGIEAAPAQALRAIALSSGTQEGNPIDRVIGELARGHGLALRPLPRPDAGGKAYFLLGLLRPLVIAEAPLAGRRLQRQRRRRVAAWSGATLASLLLLGSGLAAWQSYRHNLAYVEAVQARVDQLAARAAGLGADQVDQWLPLASLLQRLATNDGIDPREPPAGFGFGLFQGPRLARSAEQAWRDLLDRRLAPALVERLRRDLREADAGVDRESALRAALMLGDPARLSREAVQAWAVGSLAAGSGPGERAEWQAQVQALLERSGLPEAMRPDEAGLQAARAALVAKPLAQRVHERLLSEALPPGAPAVELAAAAGEGSASVFSASPAGALQPALLPAAWRSTLEPALPALMDRIADESPWLLGPAAAAEGRRLADDKAWRDDIAAQVGRRHAQAVIAAWERQLAGLALQPPPDGPAAARFAFTLTGPDSPLRRLLSRIAGELAPGPAPATPAAAAFESTLRARLGEVGDHAAGPALQLLDRLQGLLVEPPGAARDAALDTLLRQETARAPTVLRPLNDSLGRLMRARGAPASYEAALAELARQCEALTRDRYPFAGGGAPDIAPTDFARLFGSGGLFDEFARQQLASGAGAGAAPTPVDAGTRRAVDQAAAIRRLFFPDGAPLPELRLTLTPRQMDPALLQFSLDVDGQLLRFENGPPRARELAWPGPAASRKVLLRILPPGPNGIAAEMHEGPMAWLRVLQRQAWSEPGTPSQRLRFSVDGRTLDVDLVPAVAGADPRQLLELPRFRCPQVPG